MDTFQPNNRNEWREWLKTNHSNQREIWLIYFKKHTKKQTISYIDSVEEAICFGWIDGIKKRVDEKRYTHRFTPRRKNSRWSATNIDNAKKMIELNKMSDIGLKFFEQRKEYKNVVSHSSISIEPNQKFHKILLENDIAWKYFQKLPPSHKKQYNLWINSAKKEKTKLNRITEAIKLLESNKKLGMK